MGTPHWSAGDDFRYECPERGTRFTTFPAKSSCNWRAETSRRADDRRGLGTNHRHATGAQPERQPWFEYKPLPPRHGDYPRWRVRLVVEFRFCCPEGGGFVRYFYVMGYVHSGGGPEAIAGKPFCRQNKDFSHVSIQSAWQEAGRRWNWLW